MPPKQPKAASSREQTKAEEWRTGDLARYFLDEGVAPSEPPEFIEAMARLMGGTIACEVDGPLQEALDKGFLEGARLELRAAVAQAALWAYAETSAFYTAQLARPAHKARQETAMRLAQALRQFVDEAEDEADRTDGAAAKLELDVETEALWGMVEHGGPLAGLLETYAASPLPEAVGGPRTDHEAGPFGRALADWWNTTALHRDRHGAEAVRNRIAAALWTDLGRSFPDASTGQAWAERWLGKV